MNFYLALLRGINVAGQKKIKMADLKALFEGLDFTNVQTYIQSGNVVFAAHESRHLQTRIETAITKQFGFDVPVLLLTAKALDETIKKCPFGEVDLVVDGSKIIATMLSETPKQEDFASILPFKHESESCVIDGKVVYIKCPNGYGNTKLSNAFLEKKLKVVATTRNLKSLLNLQMLTKVEE